MKNFLKYSNIIVGGIIKMDGNLFIIIKEIFIHNGIVYVSYDDNIGGGLMIEKIDKFIIDKQEYLDGIMVPKYEEKEHRCGCGCNK